MNEVHSIFIDPADQFTERFFSHNAISVVRKIKIRDPILMNCMLQDSLNMSNSNFRVNIFSASSTV